MTRTILAGALAAAMLLGACTTVTAPDGTTTTKVDPAKTLAEVKASCDALKPTLDAVPAASATANAKTQAAIAQSVSYANSVCASEAAMQAAVSADPNGGTASWVAGLGAGIVAALPAIIQATQQIQGHK